MWQVACLFIIYFAKSTVFFFPTDKSMKNVSPSPLIKVRSDGTTETRLNAHLSSRNLLGKKMVRKYISFLLINKHYYLGVFILKLTFALWDIDYFQLQLFVEKLRLKYWPSKIYCPTKLCVCANCACVCLCCIYICGYILLQEDRGSSRPLSLLSVLPGRPVVVSPVVHLSTLIQLPMACPPAQEDLWHLPGRLRKSNSLYLQKYFPSLNSIVLFLMIECCSSIRTAARLSVMLKDRTERVGLRLKETHCNIIAY